MKTIEKMFFFLFPLSLLKGSPWEDMWKAQERKDFYFTSKVFFSITLVGYILHYFTVDRAEGLAPSDLWFNYRFGMAAISLLCLVFYQLTDSMKKLVLYKLPAIIAGGLFCYFQTRTIIWYPKVPYLYSFAFVLVCVSTLRMSVLNSVVISTIFLGTIFQTLVESGLSPAMAFSASFFTNAVVVFVRAKYASDLKYFIAVQNNLQQQKKIIEISLEFSNHIKSFLPGEISRRLTHFVQDQRMSIVQSIDLVLKPKKQFVACLFSDIRGFTRKSNDLNGFVTDALLPEVKASTIAIENRKGISRKIGDLIFSYFDFDNESQCVESAFQAACDISELNQKMNSNLRDDVKISRFILLSCGEAIVGNLSNYDSAIEITAIGSPVNILSRIDEATKQKQFKEILESGDIVMTSQFYDLLVRKYPYLNLEEVILESLDVSLRDFEFVTKLYIYRKNAFIKENNKKAAA